MPEPDGATPVLITRVVAESLFGADRRGGGPDRAKAGAGRAAGWSGVVEDFCYQGSWLPHPASHGDRRRASRSPSTSYSTSLRGAPRPARRRRGGRPGGRSPAAALRGRGRGRRRPAARARGDALHAAVRGGDDHPAVDRVPGGGGGAGRIARAGVVLGHGANASDRRATGARRRGGARSSATSSSRTSSSPASGWPSASRSRSRSTRCSAAADRRAW